MKPNQIVWRTCESQGIAFAAVVLLTWTALAAQAPPATAITSEQATALVQRAIDLSLAQAKTHEPMRYTLHKADGHRDTTKEIIETKEGAVARLIAVDGKPLSPEANGAELDRLNNLLAHPELQQKRHRDELRDTGRVTRLEALLPQAFLFTAVGAVPCGEGSPDTCERLSFTPNPAFTPPDMEANLFRGVAGEVWIDRQQGWMTRLDAHFIADTTLGLGLLARVDKGSTAQFQQNDVCGRDWEVTGMQVNLAGKLIMFKNMNVHMHQQLSDFKPAPQGIGYKDAIKLLEGQNETAGLQ